jgi:hypothetical protein
MSLSYNFREHNWKAVMQARLIDMIENGRKQGVILLSYDGPLSVCPNCGRRISDKWTHISDPSGVGCHGFLTKEIHEFQDRNHARV